MTDFPRGWIQGTATTAATASVSAPAIAGVVHVLDAVTARLVSGVADGPFEILVNSSDGTFINFPLGWIATLGGAGEDEISLSDLAISAGPGASLTVAFSSSTANSRESLVAQGHDI